MPDINFCEQLPNGYTQAAVYDLKNNKLLLILVNLLCLGLTLLSGFVVYFIKFGFNSFYTVCRYESVNNIISAMLLLAIGAIVYIVLHELAHGVAYKLITRRKLSFGISATYAYCGVPDIFVTRKTALIAVFTPLVLFSVVFLVPLFFINGIFAFVIALLFALHFGGCSGDMFIGAVLLLKYRDRELLFNDTGPKQTIYLKQ